MCYRAGIIDWTINVLVNMDKRIRKKLAKHGCPHTWSNVESMTWSVPTNGTIMNRDKMLKHNRPDITVVQKDTQKWTLIDIAVPADQKTLTIECCVRVIDTCMHII